VALTNQRRQFDIQLGNVFASKSRRLKLLRSGQINVFSQVKVIREENVLDNEWNVPNIVNVPI
jgi:hypothetical protein